MGKGHIKGKAKATSSNHPVSGSTSEPISNPGSTIDGHDQRIINTRPSDLKQLNDSVWEFHKPRGEAHELDVILFHGFQLSRDRETFWKTWLSRDKTVIWPKEWLVEVFPKARILSISYDSFLRWHSADSRQISQFQIVENLIQDIIWSSKCKAGQNCSVILVGHCLGGIIIKEFLLKCQSQSTLLNPEEGRAVQLKAFLKNCKGIFYYSTPHGGIKLIEGVTFANEILQVLSTQTARINDDFSKLRNNPNVWNTPDQRLAARAIGETCKTELEVAIGGTCETGVEVLTKFKVEIVPEASARQDVDQFYSTKADHFDVSRAKNKSSCYIFTGLCEFIHDGLRRGDRQQEETSTTQALQEKALQEKAHEQAANLGFVKDPRYIQLHGIEAVVKEELENFDRSPMVLLVGGSGEGKSSLARNLVLEYVYQPLDNSSKSSLVTVTATSSCVPGSSNVFEDVIFLECGRHVELLDTLKALRERLGGDAASYAAGDQRDVVAKSVSKLLRNRKVLIVLDDVWDEDFLKSMIHLSPSVKTVRWLVTSQRGNLCERLASKYTSFGMKVTQDDAQRILASHTGLFDHEGNEQKLTSPQVETLMKVIIEKCEFNPHAIACVATAINPNTPEDVSQWQDAVDKLHVYLGTEQILQIHDKAYPYSFSRALELKLDGLPAQEHQLNLMLLLSMCEGAVPEQVIKLFYERLRVRMVGEISSSKPFWQLRHDLSSRRCIKVIDIRECHCWWSIHDLDHEYLNHTRGDQQESILSTLKSSKEMHEDLVSVPTADGRSLDIPTVDVVEVLAATYFSERFAAKILVKNVRKDWLATLHSSIRQVGNRFLSLFTFTLSRLLRLHFGHWSRGSNSESDIIGGRTSKSRRSAFERIARLLLNNVSEDWTPVLHSSVRKVYVYFIWYGLIDAEGVSNLLNCPPSREAMSAALVDLLRVEDIRLDQRIIRVLLSLAEGESPRACNGSLTASQVLQIFAEEDVGDDNVRRELANFPDNLQLNASQCNILQTLAQGGVGHDNVRREIVNFPGALGGLVDGLYDYENPDVRELCATALANLTCGDSEICEKIGEFPLALLGLVRGLRNDSGSTSYAQQNSARALANLLCLRSRDRAWEIVNAPRALEALVIGLYNDDDQYLQENCARALANLTGAHYDEIAWNIGSYPPALAGLAEVLVRNSAAPFAKQLSARALVNLALVDSHELRLKIANAPRVLKGLVDGLYKDDNRDLQEQCGRAVGILACDGLEICKKIEDYSPAIEGLVKVLAKDSGGSPIAQTASALALANLAGHKSRELQRKIANDSKALEGLVNGLYNADNRELQGHCALAFVSLAYSDLEMCRKIGSYPLALAGLVKVLAKDSGSIPEARINGAWALANLVIMATAELGWKIANTPQALEELVNGLYDDEHQPLQVACATALAHLTNVDETSWKIGNYPLALTGLVKVLSRDSGSSTNGQVASAATLANLAKQDSRELRWKIVNGRGALQELVNGLYNDDNRYLQEWCATALANVACGDLKTCTKIGNHLRALTGLVKMLARDNSSNSKAQVAGARALANLSRYHSRDLKWKIANDPRALEELVNGLYSDDNRELQELCGMAVTNLGTTDDLQLQRKILEFPRAAEGLLNVATKYYGSNPLTQQLRTFVESGEIPRPQSLVG